MSTSHSDAVGDLRLRLLANGYEPLPIIAPSEPVKSAGKRPRLDGWRSMQITPGAVRSWSRDYPRDINTGIRCGQIIGLDLDILDAAIVGEVEQMAIAILGTTPLRRIGRAPKLLLAYRAGEAMAKAETPEFFFPDGQKAQVEILADGQQFVSHGTHPETRLPYTWTYKAPEEVPLLELPPITAGRIRTFLAAASAIMREHGGRTRKEAEAAEVPPRPARQERLASTTTGGFFRDVNSRALADCDAWVRQVFPRARWQPNSASPPGAWRVSSEDLGRGLEEDISVHPIEGCQDFGTRESMTPIDLIMQHMGAPDATKAALWLCDVLRVDPASLGWKGGKGKPEPVEAPSAPEHAKPLAAPLWVDGGEWSAASIPARPWVVPGYLMRGSVSVLSGQGAGGKSSLVVAWTIALATGEALGEFVPRGSSVVVNYNVEDDRDEQLRRYTAGLIAGKKTPRDIASRVIRCGPENIGTLLERDPATGQITPTRAMDALEQLLIESGASVLICDPLAELHNAEENDNTAMRSVVAAFRGMARRLSIAIMILHHDRKGTNAPGDMDRMRGASAITGAVRVMMTLTTMSEEEAEKFGVAPEHRRRHFRIDGAKSNYAIAQDAEWWKLAGIEIGNGEEIAACRPWTPPGAFSDLSMNRCLAIIDTIRQGHPSGRLWGCHTQSKAEWAGTVIMAEGKSEGQAKTILAAWKASGLLIETTGDSPRRGHDRAAFAVDDAKFAEMRRENSQGPRE